jgi:hypothetical protein
VWPAIHYFALWAVKLSGFLPDLRLHVESREIAAEILSAPIGQLTAREWTRDTGADLRRALVRQIQDQSERRLHTAAILESI